MKERLSDVLDDGSSESRVAWSAKPPSSSVDLERIWVNPARLIKTARWAGANSLRVGSEYGDQGTMNISGFAAAGNTATAAGALTVPRQDFWFDEPPPDGYTTLTGRSPLNILINNYALTHDESCTPEQAWARSVQAALQEAFVQAAIYQYESRASAWNKIFTVAGAMPGLLVCSHALRHGVDPIDVLPMAVLSATLLNLSTLQAIPTEGVEGLLKIALGKQRARDVWHPSVLGSAKYDRIAACAVRSRTQLVGVYR